MARLNRSRENPIARAVAKQRMGALLRDIVIKAHLTAVVRLTGTCWRKRK